MWIATTVALALLALRAPAPLCAQEPPWWNATQRADERLRDEDLTTLARSLAQAPPSRDVGELLFRLEVCVRAGHDDEVPGALAALAAADPPLPSHVAAEIVDALVERQERAFAVLALELFPAAQPGRGQALLLGWAAEVGWEPVDRWAAARQPAAPAYWLDLRLRLRDAHDRSRELLAELEQAARAHPGDVERFLLLGTLRHSVSFEPDLAWMADAFRPRSALDAARLALESSGAPAVALFERALELPVPSHDIPALAEWVRTRTSMPFLPTGDEGWRAWLRASIRSSLVEAYRAAGAPEKAQELLQELARETPASNGLPSVSLFLAGRVQADSGARVFEQAVRAAEEEQRDSPEYWTSRADYYRGRGERDQELAAIEQALALSPFAERAAGRYFLIFWRAGLLARNEAFEFLCAEAAAMPVESVYEGHTLANIAMDYADLVRADQEVFWQHLGETPVWGLTEERLLRALLQERTPEERAEFWTRAERLAAAEAPARVPTLAWIAHRQGDARRALTLLAPVLERVPAGEARENAAVTLFEAARDSGAWELAHSVWPLVRRRLTPREAAPWLAGLASAQARAGAADEALATWTRVANLDRRELSALEALVDAGLRPRLVAFYEDLAVRDPAAAPFARRVLARLAE